MTHVFDKAAPPDLVLSGANDGRNVGEDAIYSGTLAIAPEATFWGVPAIGFSRTKGGASGDSEVNALRDLILKPWATRDDWRHSHSWLSVNLPQNLPAAIREATVGHHKIGREIDVLASDARETRWKIRRGRPQTSQPGDENDLIDSGFITVSRHSWKRDDQIAADVIARLQPGS